MHIYLKGTTPLACTKCGKAALAHTICENCGFYKGKEAINVLAKLEKKERKEKEKEIASQEKETKAQDKLSPEQLSQPNA